VRHINTRRTELFGLLVALSLGGAAFAGPANLQPAPAAAPAAAPVSTARQAATVVMITGRGMALSADGALRALVKGSPVFEGELLTTGPSTYLNLKFADQSMFLLRPNTRFQIEEFSYEAPAAATEPLAPARRTLTASVTPRRTEAAFFRLLKGGFRAVTGAVGKSDRERFRVVTPVATIGIRGTDFETRWCDRDCDDAGLAEQDGSHTYTHDGAVMIMVPEGSLAAGQVLPRAQDWPGYSGMTRLDLVPSALDAALFPVVAGITVIETDGNSGSATYLFGQSMRATDNNGNTNTVTRAGFGSSFGNSAAPNDPQRSASGILSNTLDRLGGGGNSGIAGNQQPGGAPPGQLLSTGGTPGGGGGQDDRTLRNILGTGSTPCTTNCVQITSVQGRSDVLGSNINPPGNCAT
jgi:hypothetical protein